MRLRNGTRLVLATLVALGAATSSPVLAAPAPRAAAVFAGGCFWCEETAFEGVPGVYAVTSGYIGGHVDNPTYEQVSAGVTGHAEAVEVVYDPSQVSYERLLDIFWRNVDPFQKDGQFCDHGSQYRAAVFYRGEDQKRAAFESLRKLEGQPRFKGKIVTEIVPATKFYRAEEYHQDYYKKNPIHYKTYRMGCGRDARLKEIWGAPAGGHK